MIVSTPRAFRTMAELFELARLARLCAKVVGSASESESARRMTKEYSFIVRMMMVIINTRALWIWLRVLHGTDQLRQRVFRIAVEHPRHRFEK